MGTEKSLYSKNVSDSLGKQAFVQEIFMPPQYLLLNGDVMTMDQQNRRLGAIAVKDGGIFRVGWNQDMEDLREQGWPVYDMAGQSILPGFIDCHSHLECTGAMAACLDGSQCTAITDILEIVRRAALDAPSGQRLVVAGVKDLNLREGRGPNRWELDRVSPRHPVAILEYTWHQLFLNSLALTELELQPGQAGVEAKDGILTGILRDPIAAELSPQLLLALPEEELAQGIIRSAWLALSKGFTTIHSMQGGKQRQGATARILRLQDQLPVHLVLWEQSADVAEVLRLQLPRFGGCGDLQADGEVGSYTAALFEPYSNRIHCRGFLNYPQEYWDELLRLADGNRLQFCAHAEGEAGIEAILWAAEKSWEQSGRRDQRHRIEHLELPTMNQLARMAKIGMIASVQPAFMEMGGEELAAFREMYGERMERLNPFLSIAKLGVVLAGGSDSPVTPYDPLLGIHCALNHPVAAERLPILEALKMFTSNAAYSGFEENFKGSLEPGKLADLVVLSADPCAVLPQHFRETVRVSQVFVAGKRYCPLQRSK